MSNDVKNIVTGLIELYGTNDPFELCKCLDICLLIHDLGNELYGFFQRTDNGTEILHINSNLDYYMQKYICCHELGHAITQPELSISFFIENPLVIKNKFEIEADTFAAELLLRDILLEEYENYTIEQIAATENVPVRLVELKLNNLSIF